MARRRSSFKLFPSKKKTKKSALGSLFGIFDPRGVHASSRNYDMFAPAKPKKR